MPRTTGEADVNGATLHYEISGDGRPLVLAHAGIADGRVWEGQFEKELPHVRKTVISGAAHPPNMERPEESNSLVLNFPKS